MTNQSALCIAYNYTNCWIESRNNNCTTKRICLTKTKKKSIWLIAKIRHRLFLKQPHILLNSFNIGKFLDIGNCTPGDLIFPFKICKAASQQVDLRF
jgi:hypothetical protein